VRGSLVSVFPATCNVPGPDFVQGQEGLKRPRKGKETEMPLTTKEKELVAVGISLAAGCKPCTNYHVREARKAGTSDDEIGHALARAIGIRESAAKIMEAHGRARLGVAGEPAAREDATETARIWELVSIGAAFAVNCTANLESHLRKGRELGISDDEIDAVVEIGAFIKAMASSHVERIGGIGGTAKEGEPGRSAAGGCGC
jgi:AhpD family alkylhydroperoxidase